MGTVLVWLFVAWLLDGAQFMVTHRNYKAIYNGFGAIESTRAKKALAPMAYRVLVPWLVGWIEDDTARLWAYEAVKVLLMAGCLTVCASLYGPLAALLMGCLWCSTFLFDYWDNYAEMLGLLLALTGNVYLACLGGVIAALSRETAGIIPFIFWSVAGFPSPWVFVATWGTILGVKMRIGHRKMYCPRFTIKHNWGALRSLREGWFLSMPFISVVWTLLALVSWRIGVVPAAWAVLVILVACWTMGGITEPRIFRATAIWIAPMLSRLIE